MSTSLYSITADLKTGDTYLASNNIYIAYGLNDIPTASVSVIPRTKEEAASLQVLDKNLFKEMVISIGINGQTKDIFNGYFVGAQTESSPVSATSVVTLNGGLYKLSQMSCALLGFSVINSSDFNRILLKAGTAAGISTTQQMESLTGSTMIDVFRGVLTLLFSYISSAMDQAQGSFSDVQKSAENVAMATLYKFHSQLNTSVIQSEFNKIITSTALSPEKYNTISKEVKESIIFQTATSPQSTFWDVLISLCEIFQIVIGNSLGTTYAIPLSPVSDWTNFIYPDDIQSISVSPFPLKLYTRCYFSTKGNIDFSSDIGGYGFYPPLSSAGELTPLEKALGTIHILTYSLPGLAIYIEGNPSYKTLLDDIAKNHWIKESFKHRTASLQLRFYPSIHVGQVVGFLDTFFKKEYQGYVTRVVHHLNSDAGIATTSVTLQYVLSMDEKKYLGIDESLGVSNPIYPSYKGDITTLFK